MKPMIERQFKFRHVNEITGIFVLGFLIVLGIGLVLGSRSQSWFGQNYEFELRLPDKGTYGLSRGSAVFVLGIEVGSVNEIHVESAGQLRATVNVQPDFSRFIRRDSVATIKKTLGVAGDSYVEISKGTGEPLPTEAPAIDCLSSDELPSMVERLIGELRSETVPVLREIRGSFAKWGALGDNLNRSSVTLEQTIARLDGIGARLEKGEGTIGRLLSGSGVAEDLEAVLAASRRDAGPLLVQGRESLKQMATLVGNLERTRSEMSELIGNLNVLTTNVQAGRGAVGRLLKDPRLAEDLALLIAETRTLATRGNETLSAVRGTMANVQAGTAKLPEITRAVAAETRDMAGLVLQTQRMLREMERLIEGIQRHWLVRGYVDPKANDTTRIPPSRLRPGAP